MNIEFTKSNMSGIQLLIELNIKKNLVDHKDNKYGDYRISCSASFIMNNLTRRRKGYIIIITLLLHIIYV